MIARDGSLAMPIDRLLTLDAAERQRRAEKQRRYREQLELQIREKERQREVEKQQREQEETDWFDAHHKRSPTFGRRNRAFETSEAEFRWDKPKESVPINETCEAKAAPELSIEKPESDELSKLCLRLLEEQKALQSELKRQSNLVEDLQKELQQKNNKPETHTIETTPKPSTQRRRLHMPKLSEAAASTVVRPLQARRKLTERQKAALEKHKQRRAPSSSSGIAFGHRLVATQRATATKAKPKRAVPRDVVRNVLKRTDEEDLEEEQQQLWQQEQLQQQRQQQLQQQQQQHQQQQQRQQQQQQQQQQRRPVVPERRKPRTGLPSRPPDPGPTTHTMRENVINGGRRSRGLTPTSIRMHSPERSPSKGSEIMADSEMIFE
eukprot:scaffold874_cov233-Pinguiococcus_pyrenoidosus.AAC.13